MVLALDAALRLPAASTCNQVTLWLPCAKAKLGLTLKTPVVVLACALPTNTPLSYNSTVAPASAVPVKAAWGFWVTASLALVPVSSPLANVGCNKLTGAVVSTARLATVVATLKLPAASLARTLSTCPPWARPVALNAQAPLASACTLPSNTPLS